MVQIRLRWLLPLLLFAFLIISNPLAMSETDPFIKEVLYSHSTPEDAILVQSGRDNATYYRYLILDDYADSPENWSQPNFNDSTWAVGAAPFGDRSSNGVQPNTDWDTSGSSPYNNDIILIRHKFQVSGIVTSAKIDVAVANFCTPYLNGNMIYDDKGGDSRTQEYWNDDAAGTITPSSFNQGANVLAVYARDYVGGWGSSNRQWIDLQITAKVFEATNESVILGDTVLVAINGGNNGNTAVSDFLINVTANDTLITTFYYENVPGQYYGNSLFEWTPEWRGVNQLYIEVSCNCSDANLTNNFYILNITAQIYRLKTIISENITIVDNTRDVNFSFTIRNTGDLNDTVTISEADSMPGNLIMDFYPNNFPLPVGQFQKINATARIPSNYVDGNHNLSFKVESKYNHFKTSPLLQRGAYADVDWKWINSTDENEIYNNTNWTKLNFDDSDWKNGNTPFGDNALGGIDYKTLWVGENYGYFRHLLNISDIGLYEGGTMKISVATNNYGNHYINGLYIYGDMNTGDGHSAEYWNEEVQISTIYLNQGPNIISSIVSNPTNTQWFDQEITVSFPQSNLWKYKTQTSNVPIYLDSTAPTSRVIGEGFYRNSSNFKIEWKATSNFEDLKGYYVYYMEKNGSTLGDWMLLGFFTDNSYNFEGENGRNYRFKSIAEDIVGNLEQKSTYDTEVRIDLVSPNSRLWIGEGDFEFTNAEGVTLKWKAENSTDILGYLIEYKNYTSNVWQNFGSETSEGERWFSPDSDDTYEIRSRSLDAAGNLETKYESDVIITFDRQKPSVRLKILDELHGSKDLTLSLDYKSENLSDVKIEVAWMEEDNDFADLTSSAYPGRWILLEEMWTKDNLEISYLVDGRTYFFRATPVDLANNENSKGIRTLPEGSEVGEAINYLHSWDNTTNFIDLPFLPLEPYFIGKSTNIAITCDEELDGEFSIVLTEYTGSRLDGMTPGQYWVDYDMGRIVFGNGIDGYLPKINSSISIIYQGFDVKTTVDLTPPKPVEDWEFSIQDRNNITITWGKPEDATKFILEYRNNFSNLWEVIGEIQVEVLEYKASELNSGYHYYRIVSVDRMGYLNNEMEGEMIEIFIETEIINEIDKENEDVIAPELYFTAVGLLAMAGTAAIYMLRKSNADIDVEGPALIPLEEVELTGEEIILDTDEGNEFSIVEGSEFSRQVLLICTKGCLQEFPIEDDDEVMCPHCGIMGDSPL